MDTPVSKESREATDRQERVAPAEESKSLATTINLKPKNGPITENTKTKTSQSKKNKKINVKKSKKIVTSSSDDSNSSVESSSDSEDTKDSSDDSEDEIKKRKAKSGRLSKKKLNEKKSKKKKPGNEISDIDSKSSLSELQKEFLRVQIQTQKQRLLRSQRLVQEQNGWSYDGNMSFPSTDAAQLATLLCSPTNNEQGDEEVKKKKVEFGSKVDFKRIDHWFDKDTHRYRNTDSNDNHEISKYDRYIFNIRKYFDFDGKYKETKVDIKSKYLKEILAKVMEDDKNTSFASKSSKVCPKKLFLFEDDIRKYYQDLKSLKKGGKKLSKKSLKITEMKLKHLKLILKYLEVDFARTKKTLFPMLESGVINYELLWGLYKPGSIVCTPTYGSRDYLRAFKVESYQKVICLKLGPYYLISGKYLEYDGKTWGKGSIDVRVPAFRDVRKITDLECFPLKYHEDPEKLRNDLLNRGKKFVSLQGVQYKVHEGMAYLQKKKEIAKVNVTSRIMIDPALHRRYFPNYPISSVMSSYSPSLFAYDSETKEDENDDCEDDQEDEDEDCIENECKPKTNDRSHVARVKDLENISEETANRDIEVDGTIKTNEIPTFSDEEYVIASSVVLGFSFNDKVWLEFSVSGVKDITWNEDAFESLVLNEDTKSILKALVQSQKSNTSKNIDDVIRGKGKGLVAVLHGPPGTGKTLTAEGIAELLKYPLYTVSAGDLGHDSTRLERQLQTILDMAYAWGAVLLLDEADVFLEKRNIADIHRNALVSIFLRLLEYFQGILFLTTNRVETFDEAFRSRIHIALRYQELTSKARQSVFKIFLDRAAALEGIDIDPFTEKEMNELSKHSLNGRQIKNTVRTALALAVQNKETLSMSHVQKVLNMSKEFERHLQGGTGFEDAMRGYF